MSKCIGCGIKLQTKNPLDIGYTPKEENKYCERCFKIKNYNACIEVENVDNSEIINKINKLNVFTLFITDLLNINEELVNTFKSINNKKALIINKCEIVPENLILSHLEENIKRVYNIKEDVFFISVKKALNLNKIINILEENKKVVICGETGSGKSTLINKLTGSNLTTSEYDNTTLDIIKIKLDDYVIYDSPGLCTNNYKLNSFNIRACTYKLKKNYAIKVEDLYLSGEGHITCYLNQNITFKSFKYEEKLNYSKIFKKNSDILLNNGFIFVKAGTKIKSNKELIIRDSIIK